MSKIRIVTDSTSDLPEEIIKEYNIAVIPLNVFFGDDKFKDRINITPSEFYGMCDSGIYDWPTTSQPSAKEFIDLYQSIFNEGYDEIISIHISSNLSGTLNSVQLAVNQMENGKKIAVIDSLSTTFGLGLTVLEAAKLLKAGKSKEEIVKTLEEIIVPYSQAVGVIDTLEYLYRGGRIGRAKKILGTLLNKKPVVCIKNGVVDSLGSVKGFDEGYDRLIKLVTKVFTIKKTDNIFIAYSDDKTPAERFYKDIKDLPGAPKKIQLVEIGPSVGAHLGPGVIAFSWIGEFDEKWFFD